MQIENSKNVASSKKFLWPEIDIVIPTLNCEENLKICLSRIRSQIYGGNLNVFIIDGGSTDHTVEVAKRNDCIINVIPNIYSTGKNGAKMVGELMGNSEYIWHIDSDNFLVGENVARKLVEGFIMYPECNIAVPFNYYGTNYPRNVSRFARYLNEQINYGELENLNHQLAKASKKGDYFIVDDLDYGVSNCSMIRREAEEVVGYYDSDVELLSRLRKRGLSRAVLVPHAQFEQKAIISFMQYVRKNARRIKFFATYVNRLDHYFIAPSNASSHFKINGSYYISSLKIFLKGKKRRDLYFIALGIAQVLIFLYSFKSVIILRTLLKVKRGEIYIS